jgi:hypothetical protein
VQKIKPRVEQVCRELGLQYNTEQNEGRIYINLQGGAAPGQMPSYDYQQSHQPQHQNYGQPMYETAYPMGPPKHSYAGAAAGGYPGAQHHGGQQQGGMQYGQQQGPQQQMGYQEPQGQKESKCCGLCIVM